MGIIAKIRNALHSTHLEVKQKKQDILDRAQSILEPSLWDELISPNNRGRYGSFIIRGDDLPNIRDLKSALNMLAAIEHATQSYDMYTLSVFSTLTLPEDIWDWYKNYAIFNSTDSPATEYCKTLIKETVFFVKEKLNRLWGLLTLDNLQKSALLFKKGMISLERYEDTYFENKRAAAAPKKEPIKAPEKTDKSEKKEGFFTTLVLKNEAYLRKIYKEDFDKKFFGEKKAEPSTEKSEKKMDPPTAKPEKIADPQTWEYYPEHPKDTLTIKNIKKYSNGIIGIAKMLDNYDIYQKSGYAYGAYVLTTGCGYDLSNAYSNFRDFDLKAIIAEQGKPMTDYIKAQMNLINGMLEKLACLADKYESEGMLKENVLLDIVGNITDVFNQEAYELRAPLDYKIQKRFFYQARAKERETYLKNIDTQLDELKEILPYQHQYFVDLPQSIVQKMLRFIANNKVDIAMNRQSLAQYEQDLKGLATASPVWFRLFRDPIEYLNNYFGRTPHSQFMTSIASRQQYLQKHKKLLTERFSRTLNNTEKNPYDFFKVSHLKKPDEKQEVSITQAILEALKKHAKETTIEKEALFKNALKTFELAEKMKTTNEPSTAPAKVDVCLDNQLTLITKEEGRLLQAIDSFESLNKTKDLSKLSDIISSLRETDCLRPKSILLLDEISEILSLEKKTLEKLNEATSLLPDLNSSIANYAMPIFLHNQDPAPIIENKKDVSIKEPDRGINMRRTI